MAGLMHPRYDIKIGSEKLNAKGSSELVRIRVVRSVGLPIDSCEVVLAEKDRSFKKNTEVKVQLGYDDDLVQVFSGLVDSVEQGISTLRILALGLPMSLLRLRLNRVFMSQKAGNIVRGLAQEGKVSVKEASDGLVFFTYVADDSMSVYEHILKLAQRCGFDVYMADDGLVFKKMEKGKSHGLSYGKDIIRVEKSELSNLYCGTCVYGESPSSFKGSETAHWISKQEVKGEAGTSQLLSICDPTVKNKDAAEKVAKANLERLKRTLSMTVETVGNPKIKLGDVVTISSVPHLSVKGDFEVREIEHYLSKDDGFTTKLCCWMMEEKK